MVATGKSAATRNGELMRLPLLSDVPVLERGADYLLITTSPSSVGLSTTVGLGQGCFSVFTSHKEELAVNESNNVGLGIATDGPLSYSQLAEEIRALVGQ